MKEAIDGLLRLSDRQLDEQAKAKIRRWSDPPKPLEILHTLDMCVFGSLCSDFEVRVLDAMFDIRLRETGETRESVVAQATWRNDP